MKILVTGGLGYIGSHTVVELLNQNYQVVIVDNLSNTSLEVLDGIYQIANVKPDFELLDLRNKSDVEFLFKKYDGFDGVIHFAASKAVGESVINPLHYYENNINSLVYLLQEVLKNPKTAFIFSSSCTVYGQSIVLPITEKAPFQTALSPYGNTKQIGEEIIEDVVKSCGLNAILLRYFNPIGAHHSGLIGELPLGIPQNLVPYITQTALGIRTELAVFGNDYNTADGTCVRDYIHVVDLAKAHVISLVRLLNQKNVTPLEVFNLGTGNGHSVLELIHTFQEVTGVNIPYKFVDRRAGDVESAYSDTQKATDILGWKANLSLADALKSAWLWEQNHTSKILANTK